MPDSSIIEVRNLKKAFSNEQVLKGIDFEISAGQLISIIGKSGCGKTTFLRCLNCLEVFDSGYLRVGSLALERKASKHNDEVEKDSDSGAADLDSISDKSFREKAYQLRNAVGMLFQNFNLFPHLDVLENVTLAPIHVKKLHKSDAEILAKKMLNKVGMLGFADRKPYQLSGGQAQRVAIARALAMNPMVMLYDEPTSALDPHLTQEVLEVMKNLYSDGMTQIIVTHDMSFARNASNYIVYMENGEIIEKTEAEEIFTNPKSELTRVYLSLFD